MSFDTLIKQAWDEFHNSPFQVSNKFNLLIYKNFSISTATTTDIAGSALDVFSTLNESRVANTYLQTISFPPSIGINFERLHETTYASDVVYPGDVTMTFIEIERGDVMRMLRSWMSDIFVEPDPTNLANYVRSGFDLREAKTDNGYVFKSNQRAAKRTGMLILRSVQNNKTPLFPRVMLYGLKLAAIDNIELDQKNHEPLTISATFSVERVYIPTLI